MSKPVILLGAGGHAAVVADALLASGGEIAGVVDPSYTPGDEWRYGLRVLGDDQCINDYAVDEIALVNGLGVLPGQNRRRALYQHWRGRGYAFTAVVHPAAIVGRQVTIGEGVQIMAGAVVNSGASLGPNTIINTRAVIEHDVAVGDHCHIAPGAVVCGDCRVQVDCFVGAGAVVIQGQILTPGTVVPAGACVR